MQRIPIISALFLALTLMLLLVPLYAQNTTEDTGVKTIYIVPSSHYDLGFIVPPEDILEQLKPHVDEIIHNAKTHPDFRFTIEDTWHVLEWLKRTDDPNLKKDFAELVNQGQIQVSTTFGSMHTEFMGVEGLNRIAYDWTRIASDLDITSDFAMMNDVPGFIGRLPQVLAESGVKYFLTGSNLFIGGGTDLYPGKMPIYWEARDGSRVLMWQTQGKTGGYTEAIAEYFIDPRSRDPYSLEPFYPEEYHDLSNLEIMEKGVQKMLDRYADDNYQYDALLALHSHDFVSSDWVVNNLLPSVREWNDAQKTPKLVVATAAEFFHHIESKYEPEIPTYRGAWTGLWAEVKINSPGISATARWVHNHHAAAEMVWSALSVRDGKNQLAIADDEVHGEWFRNIKLYPEGNLDQVTYKLYKFEEHSGSGQTGWPMLMTRDMIDRQNSQYVEYVSTSREDIQVLLDAGIKALGSETYEPLPGRGFHQLIFNPLSWTRTDVATITDCQEKVTQIIDLTSGEQLPFALDLSGAVEFLAPDVPGLGYKLLWVETEPGSNSSADVIPGVQVCENAYYRVEGGNSEGFIQSILDKQSGRELVGHSATHHFNQLLRWTFDGDQTMPMGNARYSVYRTPVADRLIISRHGTMWPETVITLFKGIDRIDIANQLDRRQMPFVPQTGNADYYSFMFPANFSESPQVWLENGQGLYRYPEDYLPGARMDGAAPRHTLVLEGNGTDDYQIVLGQKETFYHHFVVLPGSDALYENTIKAAVLRKFDQGAARDWGSVYVPSVEPGLEFADRYHYTLSTQTGDLDKSAAIQTGAELNSPLLSVSLPGTARTVHSEASFFSYDAENVHLIAFKQTEGGMHNDCIIRLQEVGGEPATFQLNSFFTIVEATQMSLTEDVVEKELATDPLVISLQPYELTTVKLLLQYPEVQE